MEENKRLPKPARFVVFWERMANSGVIEIVARSKAQAIEFLGYDPAFVKMTAYRISGKRLVVGLAK